MRRFLPALAVLALGWASMGASCGKPRPPKPPTPTPTPELGPGIGIAPEMLVRPAAGARLTRNGQPWVPFMFSQCCRTFRPAPNYVEVNSKWPMQSREVIDYVTPFGADLFEFRLGPFYATDETEVEFKDVGGPYIGDGPEFHEPFWTFVWGLGHHAAKANANVIFLAPDLWYCKHAQWGDQKMPWPREDIEACGRRMTPGQERFLRKVVSTFTCLGNGIWQVDNEGDNIQGSRREWYEAAAAIIRDQEQKSPCLMPDGSRVPFVHMIGTNNPEMGDLPAFDYIAVHHRAPLTASIHGKWVINSERNPEFSPEADAAYFAEARSRGLGWAFWRAGWDDEKFERALRLYRDVVKGPGAQPGCFAPADEDPRWKPGPVLDSSPALRLVNEAKAEVGDRRHLFPREGTAEEQFEAMFATLDLVAAALRRRGECSSRMRDSVFVKVGALWHEFHVVAATDGGYTGQPFRGSTWIYQ